VTRETREETGLEIEVERLTGYYRFTGLRRSTDAVFRAHPVGGRLRPSREAWRLEWVAPDQLPGSLFPWYRQRIADALLAAGATPPERVQHVGLAAVGRHGLALMADLGGSILRSRSRPDG
jgi:ADP-ribose pyrophosphatase YjhB (NUDIX family)